MAPPRTYRCEAIILGYAPLGEADLLVTTYTRDQGKVKAVANGHQDILSIKIDPEVVDPEDVEMLEDLVFAAVKDAIAKSKELSSKKMQSITAGLPIPPGMM